MANKKSKSKSAYNKAYYKKNAAAHIERVIDWQSNNKEKAKAYTKTYIAKRNAKNKLLGKTKYLFVSEEQWRYTILSLGAGWSIILKEYNEEEKTYRELFNKHRDGVLIGMMRKVVYSRFTCDFSDKRKWLKELVIADMKKAKKEKNAKH
jgi:hypothetical protein